MLAKERVLAAVQELPESFSMEELMERVRLLEKIERGLQQSLSGEVKDKAQAKEQLRKWLQ